MTTAWGEFTRSVAQDTTRTNAQAQVTAFVDAPGPKNRRRMSFSNPITR